MSFEEKQKSYYTQEINRALPTRRTPSDLTTLNAALQITDPVMPVTGVRQLSDAEKLVSSFGLQSDAQSKDTNCRSIMYPGDSMRARDARTGCGWWFVDEPTIPSSGAYGSRRGPMTPFLDTQVGPGRWIWDPKDAYQQESMKQASSIRSCPDIQFKRIDAIGWCPSTNRAVVTDGNGNPAFPQSRGGDCPGGGIVMQAGSCPPPLPPGDPGAGGPGSDVALSQSTTALCAPQSDGSLAPACIQNLASYYCSSSGALAASLNSQYAGKSDDFNSAYYYLQTSQIPFTIHSGIINDGKVAIQDVLRDTWALRTISNLGNNSRATQAAQHLCSGAPFDPCAMSPGDRAPFNPICVTRACVAAGYSPDGTLLPAKIGMDYWNTMANRGGTITWQDVLNNITWWKGVADQLPGYTTDPNFQAMSITHVYGVTVKWPRKGCNFNGIMMYRYLGNSAGVGLFPPNGSSTHFLGRYLLKNGLPFKPNVSALEQTPAGGYPMENQRLVANFIPKEGGTYQFVLVQMYTVTLRMVINDINFTEKPADSGAPTPITKLNALQSYPLIIDIINATGAWAFYIYMSVNGRAWEPIPPDYFFLPADRRTPMIELPFHTQALDSTGTQGYQRVAQADTTGVFQNLFRWNAPIGTLNGRQCMLVTQTTAGLFNYQNINQGIRFCAMKSFTLMVQIDSVTIGAGITPTLVSFFNPAGTNPLVGTHGQQASINNSAPTRQDDFEITLRADTIYPWAFNQGPKTSAFMANIMSGAVGKYTQGQWTHIAFVWNEDFAGYSMYTTSGTNDNPTTSVVSAFCPPYSPTLIMDNIRVGGDNQQIDKCFWTGGVAWFRAFDYRLTKEQVLIDFKDQWDTL